MPRRSAISFLSGNPATSDPPLMPAGEALPVRSTYLLHATAQHGVASLEFLEKLSAGKAVADVDASLVPAGGADEQPDGHAASAR
ncbi:MAG: hypothetical protein EOO77_05525 [Oxalobacteraceae bacterium]|nr:MAG: hypothetical protein EOO77_05525 [Oxalobacteraceae bacterium]